MMAESSSHHTMWHQVNITLRAPDTEMAVAALAEIGSVGMIEERKVSGEVLLICYFKKISKIKNPMKSIRQLLEIYHVHYNRISSKETVYDPYEEGWKQHFVPKEIVRGIVVAPSWESSTPCHGEKVITMDPGMAFGTGQHESTRLAARAIATRGALSPPPVSLLDVGSGSGILCLVAHSLGIPLLYAIENDDVALETARENFGKNNAAVYLHRDLTTVKGPFDIIVANILLTPLIDMRHELLHRLHRKGSLILAGITGPQEEELANAYLPLDLSLRETIREGEWSCLTFTFGR